MLPKLVKKLSAPECLLTSHHVSVLSDIVSAENLQRDFTPARRSKVVLKCLDDFIGRKAETDGRALKSLLGTFYILTTNVI
jgi:hypothetical protein